MKKKLSIVLTLIIVIAIGSYIFIKNSNDHKECSTVKSVTTDENENKVAVEKHVCKEKYNF